MTASTQYSCSGVGRTRTSTGNTAHVLRRQSAGRGQDAPTGVVGVEGWALHNDAISPIANPPGPRRGPSLYPVYGPSLGREADSDCRRQPNGPVNVEAKCEVPEPVIN